MFGGLVKLNDTEPDYIYGLDLLLWYKVRGHDMRWCEMINAVLVALDV